MASFHVLAEMDESIPLSPLSPRRGSGACGLVYDESMLRHAACGIERPDRLVAIMRHLTAHGLPEQCERVQARPCSEAEARLVHGSEHWQRLLGLPDSPLYSSQMDANEHTAESSRLAAGSVVELTDRVCRGALRSGFALVRPPGHHAGHSSMQGFCFLNNIAIAARAAQARHKLSRILVVDWDVHHGNGTQAMLADDPRIMYVSLHRRTRDFFPRTGDASEVGAGAGTGFTVNIPWRRIGMGDGEYVRAFSEVVMPIAAQFDPQLVLVSAGFDAADGDVQGGMRVTADGFAQMTSALGTLGRPLALALEGGYNQDVTARCVAQVMRALLGDVAPLGALDVAASSSVCAHAEAQLRAAIDAHAAYWPCLRTDAHIALVEHFFDRSRRNASAQRASQRVTVRAQHGGSGGAAKRQRSAAGRPSKDGTSK